MSRNRATFARLSVNSGKGGKKNPAFIHGILETTMILG
nr:MAG TPA: hypothetical protein [Caudoviricetes sp.]